MSNLFRRLLATALLLLIAGCASPRQEKPDPVQETPDQVQETPWAPVDLLVFAPHPDDETLGAGGVIMKALAAGKRVHIVIFTNGDGYPHALSQLVQKPVEDLKPPDYLELARVRQLEVHAALAILGLKTSDVTFLGYPDAGLDKVYHTLDAAPFTQQFTGKNETYGMAQQDFRFLAHGTRAPYRQADALADVKDLISRLQPAEIYVTHPEDKHPDHKAAHWFVRDAVGALGFAGKVYTYLIHRPQQDLAPGPVQIPLTQGEVERKLRAIRAYSSQVAVDRDYLEAFARSEERFWYLNDR